MGEGRGVHRVLVVEPEGKRPLGDQEVDGRIILRWIFGSGSGGDWMDLAEVRSRWRAHVKTMTKFRVP